MLYSNQVAIVTGASGGLGRHIALSLASDGASVVCTYRTNQEKAETVKTDIEQIGGTALAIQADVRSESDIEALINQTLERFSRTDILINNAGISLDGISWKYPLETWQQIIEVNLTGVFLCTKHVLPQMRKQEYGRILNITSVVSQAGVPGASAYAASKSGLNGFTKSVAREVVSKNITVNALALGYFDEGMLYTIPPEILDVIRESIPLKRFGRVEELTWAVRFLCAPQASYITGQVININGGLL
jgi:3-oxoacyl-[acyl-carrier protein] reductase